MATKKRIPTYKVELAKRALKAPSTVAVAYNGLEYNFHFYVNDVKRYVALCNTVGGHDLYGEGHTWWAAMNVCMEKVMERKKIESRSRKRESWDL